MSVAKHTCGFHYENLSMQYTEIFSVVKIENFIEKISIFSLFVFAQNIDCGYKIEPRQQGGSNDYLQSKKKKLYTPANPILYKSVV